MPLGTSFDLLSRIVEQYESEGRSVRAVEASTDDDGTVRATVTVPAAFPGPDGEDGPTLAAESASVDEECGIGVTFSAPHLEDAVERVDAAVSADVRGAATTDDGGLLLTVEVVIEGSTRPSETTSSDATPTADLDTTGDSSASTEEARGPTGDRPSADDTPTRDSSTAGGDGLAADGVGTVEGGTEVTQDGAEALAAVRDESVPPYDDVDYLERLYERCETFTEMSRRIEMDVASETVRRYMIEAGVHAPTTYDTAPRARSEAEDSRVGEGDAEGSDTSTPDDDGAEGSDAVDPDADPVGAEPLVADGVGLPDEVRIPDVVDAVVGSVTLYELARRLDLEEGDARELLQQLNLLEFVPRRLPAGPEQELSHEDVAGHIRRSAPTAGSA
ncbi:hypothetical protein ACFO0N_21635 [Halobium salinum]|uniref:Uncharacterized protein n=1 Tax=Halobium salinum TaxID=1364940 RepID=A0ABD5PI21_9EURY|nr:hypothetical protein [Halobium salinum]